MDMVRAVRRQRRFTRRIVQYLHWDDHDTLAVAISRYERFIDLMGKYKNVTLVPTLGKYRVQLTCIDVYIFMCKF
jgi:hypothetical protein